MRNERDSKADGMALLLLFVMLFCTVWIVVTWGGIPITYIRGAYVPALDTNSNGNGTAPFNTSVFIDFEIQRLLAVMNLDYKGLEMTLSYGYYPRFTVGNFTLQGFTVGRKTRVHKTVAVDVPGLPWEEAYRAVSDGSTVCLTVEIMNLGSRPRRSRKVVGLVTVEIMNLVYVAVDGSGHMVSKNPISLYV